jgi:hypothetical protein
MNNDDFVINISTRKEIRKLHQKKEFILRFFEKNAKNTSGKIKIANVRTKLIAEVFRNIITSELNKIKINEGRHDNRKTRIICFHFALIKARAFLNKILQE